MTLLSSAQKFEVLLGKPEFSLDIDDRLDDSGNSDPSLQDADEAMLQTAQKPVATLPKELLDLVRIDLSVARGTGGVNS